jgi:hypothetical protein
MYLEYLYHSECQKVRKMCKPSLHWNVITNYQFQKNVGPVKNSSYLCSNPYFS